MSPHIDTYKISQTHPFKKKGFIETGQPITSNINKMRKFLSHTLPAGFLRDQLCMLLLLLCCRKSLKVRLRKVPPLIHPSVLAFGFASHATPRYSSKTNCVMGTY